MIQKYSRARSSQNGFSAFEALLVLALIAGFGLLVAQSTSADRQDIKLASVASRLTELRSAADRYIRDNFGAVETAATAGPVSIAITTLQNGNYLPGTYSNTNEYGQTHYVYARRRAPGVLESIVVATGGRAMNQLEGGKVATLLKGPGGYVPVGSGTATGTKGGWTLSLASFVPGGLPAPSGSPAAYSLIRKNDGPTGALMRDDTGNPADNRMGTNLDMNWHDILNVRNIGVGNTIINQNTVQNINDLASINCANGEVLTKIGSAIMCVTPSGMPTGGVAAFTSSCPSGWAMLPGADGRVLVASGGGLSAGDTGGNDWLTLTEAQMPAHSHKTVTSGTSADWELRSGMTAGTVRSWSDSGGDQEYSLNTSPEEANRGDSSKAGGGQAFDNRQSYFVVNYCRKQ